MPESFEDLTDSAKSDPVSDIATQVMSRAWAQGFDAEEHGFRYGSIQEIADPILATALAEAKAQARRDAFEEAAKDLSRLAAGYGRVVDTDREQRGDAEAAIMLTSAARRIRALATAPAETEKPETGEDGR